MRPSGDRQAGGQAGSRRRTTPSTSATRVAHWAAAAAAQIKQLSLSAAAC